MERTTYELPRDPDGQFTLEVARRGERQEEAVYSIEGNYGVYIMKIIYRAPEDGD